MDREIPSVPITTLAGVASLTDLLPEMPLPTPSPQTLSNKSLLFHPRVAEEAQNLLGVRDEVLIPQLVNSLIQTSADHIEVRDICGGADSTKIEPHDGMPILLRAMLDANPGLFNGSTAQNIHHQHQHQQQLNALHPQQLPQLQPQLQQQYMQQQQHQQQQIQHQQQLQQQQLLQQQQQQQQHQQQQQAQHWNHAGQPTTIPYNQQIYHNPQLLQQQQPQHQIQQQIQTKPIQDNLPTTNFDSQQSIMPSSQRPSVITEKPPAYNANCNNTHISADPIPFPTVAGTTSTELRQLRRPVRGLESPAQASDAPPTMPSAEAEARSGLRNTRAKSKGDEYNTTGESNGGGLDIKQPIIKLDRLKEEDHLLMQKSLKKFAETRPELAKELGIVGNRNTTGNNKLFKEEDESEEDAESGRRKKRRKDDSEDDDDYKPDQFTALVGKRRKIHARDEKPPEPVLVKPKLRRVEKKFVPVLEKLSVEELMETNTYQRFNRSVELVLKTAEDYDITEIMEDAIIQDEYLLSRNVMQELCNEAAKLKNLGVMETIPTDKLVRLINVMDINIRGGNNISPITDEEDSESMRQIWLESTMERVMLAADACLISLYIMTSQNMSKRVYMEEVIDRIVLYIRYHLHNTIFPLYDSTYRLDNKKKDGRKKKQSMPSCDKNFGILYTKVAELVALLAELLNIQILTDTSVLHASSMGVSPFFVENVSELQLACLKLVTTIFTRYESHRRLLLDDILASIARLPSTKRSLRSYRLNSEEHIQMLTALVLQLIQCVVCLPDKDKDKNHKDRPGKVDLKIPNVDNDVLICNKYDKATSIAGTFLTVFLNKCGSRAEEIDYRPLFENFVQDLLLTVNKPEWPATELLLTLLGKLLVNNFSNKGTDMSLRVASLDYLGVVAARVRKDSVLSLCKVHTIDQMIQDIKQEESKDKEENPKKKQSSITSEDERIQFLQKVLLDFLAVNAQNDEAYKYARHFYITQWYKDAVAEKAALAAEKDKKNNTRDNHRTKVIEIKESDDSNSDSEEKKESIDQKNAERFRLIEEKKKFLINKIKPFQETFSSGNRIQVFQTYIDYSSAELIAQYLASKRFFSQSFDRYLKAILMVLKETSIAIRTKAMKCLTMIVEADPSVLGRHDMQMGVNHSFFDHSTSVREAAVDLVGKFVLSRPELINKYYEVLSARILDTGVSVRKRVIKILKDICIERPEFPKIPEICIKMIRRVNDEEGIRKLVMEVFQNMWFTPTKDDSLLRKVMNITDVVSSSQDIGLEWFEQLLLSLFKPKEDKDDSTKIATEPSKALLLACRQIVDCLIENVLRLESSNDSNGSNDRLVSCVKTLHLFAKVRPQLLVKHASTLQPYLGLKCQSAGDIQIISCVAKMLELVVPLMEHPSESFLAQLEEDATKLILRHDQPIVISCLSLLGSITNKVTRNFKLIRDCFNRYFEFLKTVKNDFENNDMKNFMSKRCYFRRGLFITGLLLRHFDFKDPEVIGDLPSNTKDEVYSTMVYFLQQPDVDVQTYALKAIGSFCIRHYEFMLEDELKVFYHKQLTSDDAPLRMKIEVLRNIEFYLIEEEKRMIQQDLEWAKRSKQENLKEMGDVTSGMASTVIQIYLKEILQSYLHHDPSVRHPALKVIQLVLQQGLVYPVMIVPYLICMSTDTEVKISHSADKQLQEIEKKYPGFIHTKTSRGIALSYQLQKILHGDQEIIRGSRVKEAGEYPTALNSYLYSILRTSRQQRRALILHILRQFDDQARTSLSYMLYLADNLAYFPYMVQDEPLFIVHNIDVMISTSGTNLLQSFREGLIMTEGQQHVVLDPESGNQTSTTVVSALDEDDADEDALLARVPDNTSQLQACLTAAQGCLLLLVLKQHLKDIYGLSDSKIQQYSPSEAAKVYEKNATRRSNTLFNPKGTLQKLKEGTPPQYLDENGKRDLIKQYLDFKQLMLQLDPDEPEDEEANKLITALTSTNQNPNPVAATSILTEADQKALENYKDTTPKVPKLVISNRRLDSDTTKRTPRAQRAPDKAKKHRHKKKRKKFVSSSGDESENDYSDPDFMA